MTKQGGESLHLPVFFMTSFRAAERKLLALRYENCITDKIKKPMYHGILSLTEEGSPLCALK